MSTIKFVFRKSAPGQFSIEGIFNNIVRYVNISVNTSRVELPYFSSDLLKLWRNIIFLRDPTNDPSAVIHITGDVHYAVLAFPTRQTILTIHDIHSIIKGNPLKKAIFKLLWFKLPTHHARFVTVISEFTKSELLLTVPTINPDKVKVIPNPVSALIEFEPRETLSAKPKILHLGTKPNKNLDRLIVALKGLDIELLIVGQLMEEQLLLLNEHQISYRNYHQLAFEKIIDLYREADLVCFVSTYEGFGMPILEAQAAGRPVITSNLCSMPAVAGKGAILVDPYQTSEITSAIRNLISSPELRAQLVQHGYHNVRKYSIDQIAKMYLALYQQILSDEQN